MEFEFIFSPDLADNQIPNNIDLATEIAEIDKILEEIQMDQEFWLPGI